LSQGTREAAMAEPAAEPKATASPDGDPATRPDACDGACRLANVSVAASDQDEEYRPLSRSMRGAVRACRAPPHQANGESWCNGDRRDSNAAYRTEPINHIRGRPTPDRSPVDNFQ
jgi:hypothetical protein